MLLLGFSRFGGKLAKISIRSNNSRKHSAFTLAEVLITLGIIGVVAAMTLPALISKYQKQVELTRLKKAYSVISQSYMKIMADYGGLDIVDICKTNDSKCFADLFKPVLKYSVGIEWKPGSSKANGCWEDTNIGNQGEPHYCVVTPDGISYDFDFEYGKESASFYNPNALIYVDINGINKPNLFGKDRYLFLIFGNKIETKWREHSEIVCEDYDSTSGSWVSNQDCAYLRLFGG